MSSQGDGSTRNGAAQLPVEINMMILDNLQYSELKQLRLVARDWSSLATPMHFWRVYISPRREDLEIFNNVTRHPVLSTYVRKVVYDASRFVLNISRRAYFNRLCDDITKCFVLKGQDLQWPLNGHLVTALQSDKPRDEIYNSHKYDRFVDDGFHEWQRHSWYEGYSISHGVLTKTLCEGVERMNNMSSFSITGGLWQNHLNETLSLDSAYSGYPSVRRWKALYARPILHLDNKHIEVAFLDAACALRLAQNLTSLELFDGMFDIRPNPIPDEMDQGSITKALLTGAIDACTSVRSFTIDLHGDVHDNCRDLLGVLPAWLGRMKCLTELTLSLITSNSSFTYEQIFPRTGEWPQLEYLNILSQIVDEYELVTLIAKKLTKLQYLHLLNIELSNGSWECVTEGFRQMTHLRSLCLGGNYPSMLRHHHGASFVSSRLNSAYTYAQFQKDIEDYVIFGGRHPCLSPEAAAEESLDFWRRMCPSRENGRRITLLDSKIELRTWDY